MALRLGTQPPGYTQAPQPTCVCGKSIDPDCHHIFRCPNGNERQTTHDAVSHEVKKLLDAAGCATTREPYHFYVDSKSRPDLVIRSGWNDGALPHTADIAVVHPGLSSASGRGAATCQLHAANATARKKSVKYAANNRRHGIAEQTIPFVFEIFGAAAAKTTDHIRTLTAGVHKALPLSPGASKDRTHTYWTRRLICVLIKGVADGVSRRLCRAYAHGGRPPPEFITRLRGFAPDPGDFAVVDAARRAGAAP